ncbi:DUF551 domain-containing protein [Enterobacter hormaechei]|uniref:DUF551 domain-containing protein n=1 Tax=Enterobacter hormaechei TaxID=158836 RepID=UPI00079C20E9|nr:DUF551 domain-containing protein [Enterobacter hormaechei]CZU17317.1 Protein of uncharacterised function (DUF551) [Enterobacter hormaechei]CZU20120.1 Protein of uncharacterised function (DUF551) [Enterobacter hormaechei]CZU31145.1 Protein of uncharacterised function (DUF551) [Enterobacter hormaechei]CZU32261.1 Protein of uncharacterised function (DUF551) [Enterobacter hormaechei]CZY33558.1 Protein of uncharacterised function (DUF551) [Enterobacter hormaechei]
MSTITNKFTKEQLQQIEAAAKEVMWPVVWSEKKAREHFSEKITPKVVLKLARIALASLEAEAVCVIDQSNLDYLKSGSDADVWPASRAEMGDVLLYRSATPAPVSVPAAMEMDDDFDSSFEHGKAVGWNAYRAAMLQGADGNSPVIPDGWVACSERMPEEGSKVIVFRPRASESNDPPVKTATYKGGREYYHGFDCYCEPTHWMPLPAAPQQEVK